MKIATHLDVVTMGAYSHIHNKTPRALRSLASSLVLGVESKISLFTSEPLIACDIVMADNTQLSIGEHTKLEGVTISMPKPGARLRIGSKCLINRGARIHCEENIKIGNYNLIAPGSFITDAQMHDLDPEVRALEIESYMGYNHDIPDIRAVPLTIGDKCWIGIYSQIQIPKQGIDRMVIADGTVVGGSAVVKDPVLEPYKKIAGVPAKIIGDACPRFTEEQLRKMNYMYRA